jgi:hypothetical protein
MAIWVLVFKALSLDSCLVLIFFMPNNVSSTDASDHLDLWRMLQIITQNNALHLLKGDHSVLPRVDLTSPR